MIDTSPSRRPGEPERPAPGVLIELTSAATWELLSAEPAVVLLDCRTVAEWSFVGVPDLASLHREPVLVEWTRFPDGSANQGFLAELTAAGVTAEIPVAFLCRSGQRSHSASLAAMQAGWRHVVNVVDGFEGPLGPSGHRDVAGWKVAGLPWRQ